MAYSNLGRVIDEYLDQRERDHGGTLRKHNEDVIVVLVINIWGENDRRSIVTDLSHVSIAVERLRPASLDALVERCISSSRIGRRRRFCAHLGANQSSLAEPEEGEVPGDFGGAEA